MVVGVGRLLRGSLGFVVGDSVQDVPRGPGPREQVPPARTVTLYIVF